MKKFYLVVGILFLSLEPQSLFSQEVEFDLKSYKTTDYARSSLELEFDLTEHLGGTTTLSESTNNSNRENSYMQRNLGIELDLDYSKIVFSKNKVLDYGAILMFDNSFMSNESSQIDSVEKFSNTLEFSVVNELYAYYNADFYYSGKNRNFLKYGGNISMFSNYGYENEETESLSEKMNEVGPAIETTVRFDIGHGHGRIENVEDAVEAMYILNDLSEGGLLARPYTNHDIKILADKITLIRKERFFDYRLYRQKSMKELVTLLKEIVLVNSENVDVFNIVADYHYYAGINARQSGQKLEYYLLPALDFLLETKTDDAETNNSLAESLGVNVAYSFYVPVSMKWQHNFSVEAGISKLWGTRYTVNKSNSDLNTENNYESIDGNGYISYSVGYYPDTRSNYTIGASLSGNYQKYSNKTLDNTSVPLKSGRY